MGESGEKQNTHVISEGVAIKSQSNGKILKVEDCGEERKCVILSRTLIQQPVEDGN